MTEKEAKADLMRARRMESRIDALRDAYRSAWESETSVTPRYGSGGAGGSVNRKGERVSTMASEIDEQLRRLDEIKTEILRHIGEIEDNRLAAILIDYYIAGLPWEMVADKQHYSFRHVVGNLHPRALRAYAKTFHIFS